MVTVGPASAVPVNVFVPGAMIPSGSVRAGLSAGIEGAAGAIVSIVTLKAAEAAEVLPTELVCFAVMLLWTPSLRMLLVIVAMPPLATALPICVLPSKRVTVLPDIAETVNVGVVMLVMLSELEVPVSLAACRSGVPGAAGGTLSKLTLLSVLVEAAFRLPATSWTLLTSMESVTVPLVEPVMLMATLYVGPVPVTVAVFVPPAVPPMVTLVLVKSVTASLKTTVKLMGDTLVGSA